MCSAVTIQKSEHTCSAWVSNFSSISYQSSISRPDRKSSECMCICRRLWSHSVLNSYLRLPNSKESKISRRTLYGIVGWTFMLLTSFLFRPFFDWDSNILVVNLCSRECKVDIFLLQRGLESRTTCSQTFMQNVSVESYTLRAQLQHNSRWSSMNC